ncbi:MAG: HYExAFE family protein [Phycisphaerales bacterium]|nr:MAG: HYExAFE family protein [Phycisphaerales bacterium]
MRELSPNHYERAFENWLIDNRIEYVRADEHRSVVSTKGKVKSFDFLVYRREGPVIIVEVKGRRFRGASLEKLAGFECWVTREDVEGLCRWQEAFGRGYEAAFVFAYKVEKVDVDFDGREVLDFEGRRYVFFCVRLDDYRSSMKQRSPKWRTVTLPAAKFRHCAVHINKMLV